MSTATLLEDFNRLSQDLAHALEDDCELKEVDYLRLENYLLVIPLAYRHWKRRNVSSLE